MDNNLDKKIEKKIEEMLPIVLERYKIYSKEELLTREEFLEALKLINQRFEAVDKRFETMDKRFETMDKRFETMDKRFETLIQEMRYGFDKTYVILTSFGARSGVRLEKTIVNLARKALEKRDIDISSIEYNKELIDDGTYLEKGYRTHIDMYGHDSKHIFFDIKYQYDFHDMDDFIKRIKLAENFLKLKSSKNIIITLEISEETKKKAEKKQLEVISID